MTIDKICKALSDPKRLEMLKILNDDVDKCVSSVDGKACNCVFKKHFNMSQPTLTYHLKILEEAELITPYRVGKYTYYNTNRDTINMVSSFFKEMNAK